MHPLIDSHCHLDFNKFDSDRAAMIARAHSAGVHTMIVPATSMQNCQAVIDLCDAYPSIYGAVGVHPNSTATWRNRFLSQLYDLAQHPKIVAIGEIGLDYYRDRAPKITQQAAFSAQIEVADNLDLPIIVHNRDSDRDIVAWLKASPLNGKERAGVLHSFAADYATAKQILDMGFYLGFTGPVTYKNAGSLREIVAKIPLDRILIETDAPFLAPQKYRGKRNEPAYVAEVAERIATIHQRPTAEIAAITTANAQTLFDLPTPPADTH